MRTKTELLAGMKATRAARVRFLTALDTTALVKIIEGLGHFDLVDADVAWLENEIKSQEKVDA